ncbi:MAG: PAS domain-containing protein [Sedimentisphaerales bacterium]|nr:PAS domain-containing protein [Sedimentisphaerales bacterium]
MSKQPEKPVQNETKTNVNTTTGREELTDYSRTILQSLPIGVITFNKDLKIIEANPQASRLIEVRDYIDKSLAKGTDDKIWQGWTEQLKTAMSKKQISRFDNIVYTSKGKITTLRITCTPLKEATKTKQTDTLLLIEDITEKAKSQSQSVKTERLAAVGKLASKVAHELNDPLDGILRYVNLTMRIIEKENLEKPKEYLIQCRKGLMRMVQIVSELLEFSRSTYIPLEYTSIEQIIEEAIKTMDSKAETLNIQIYRHYTSGLAKIQSGNLFQVFCNLIKNALDAMQNGGELTISTYPAANDIIAAEFRDTGTGFAAENAEVIFEPFFTTKDKGKGTGLGLAICRDIIESYHGRITAENRPEGGSIFTVYLPVGNDS